ncbi:MCP methyltransferase, CheR-type [Ammonifex degensii KC4]|uniref:protein-glutamate O-methyltransferase n=1 Tax=Ammonifex degensii (strain DSM 10501 / KC4) TaxID=429009 RepID=C9R9X0_AMMDK|nr:protein-glutamate O-methyltransferase CheR [Ammonifex degensii]ACX53099.1 MCP methyltransferase, CheR-type [Ammonifex degensii KC4]
MDFYTFREKVREQLGFDLGSYKENQLRRRLEAFMLRQGIPSYEEYLERLKRDPRSFQELVAYLTISVTEFFRDPHLFKLLEDKVLPELLQERFLLKIWSAACANGAEPYSVVMILEDLTPGRRHRIEATDVNPRILAVAREGVYSADLLRHVDSRRLAKYFTPLDGRYAFRPEYRSRVFFRQHDLLRDSYGQEYDLILCRNVLIYFTKEAQDRVLMGFQRALRPGGYLFLGGSETILNYREMGFERRFPSIYQKVS